MATSYAARLMGSAPTAFSFRYALLLNIEGRRKLLIGHSGTSSAIPRDEDSAFGMQIEGAYDAVGESRLSFNLSHGCK